MSVLIKNMEMPKNCYECNLKIICDYASMNGWIRNKRDSMCPLVEVKTPHGRLIDMDKLMRDIEEYHLSDGKFQHWVDVQQTIIEAEGSEG